MKFLHIVNGLEAERMIKRNSRISPKLRGKRASFQGHWLYKNLQKLDAKLFNMEPS